MKAWILHGINDLRLEEIEKPSFTADEVLVSVKAAGICGSDIPRVFDTGAHRHPLIIGHEISGKVVNIGRAVDKSWLNKRVGIFPLIPCGTCISCKKREYETCRNYSYLGSRRDGGFAEYIVVPETNLIECPDEVGYESAAMLEPMAVAVHAIRRIKIPFSKKVVVCGIGTIGLSVIMFLRESGVENILAIGKREIQKQAVMDMGIPEENYCDNSEKNIEQWIQEHTCGDGSAFFFECVGKNETIRQAIKFTAPGGTVVLIGNPYGDMNLEREVYWQILRKQLMVVGTWNSSFQREAKDDWHYVMDRLKTGRIKPEKLITHRYSIDELDKGLKLMRDKREDYIKVMMVRNL